ncbi:MAG TPA: hypothetical protein VL308_06560 [Gemmatimonadaceae bacterium]|jgi:hypothetical protein|nr:hypothetical protein [Gemmatimonadaceae bacterium]
MNTPPGRPRIQSVSTHRRFELTGGWELCSTDPGTAVDPAALAALCPAWQPTVVLKALEATMSVSRVRRAFVVPRDDTGADTALAERLAQRGVDVEHAPLPGYAAMMVDAHESVLPDAVIDGRFSGSGPTTQCRVSNRWGLTPATLVSSQVRSRTGSPESAATFGDDRLFGILCESRGARCETGVILVNAGSVHTVGPEELTWSSRANGLRVASPCFAWISAVWVTAMRASVPSTTIPIPIMPSRTLRQPCGG